MRNPSALPFPSKCLAPRILQCRHFIRVSHTRNPSAPPFPSRCLTPRIFLHSHSTRMPRIRNPSPPPFPLGCLTSGNSVCPTFHLPRISHIRNPILYVLLNPGVQIVLIASYFLLRVSLSSKITFLIKLCCHFHFWQAIFIFPLFLKCFEICKESSSVISNNGVIGIDSGKIKWALVGVPTYVNS